MGLSGVPAKLYWDGILSGISAPSDATNYSNLNAWQACEGGGAAYNPFNTTEPWPNATDYNSVGVKNYSDLADGIAATVTTLTNGLYGGIINALQTSAPRGQFAYAVGASPWGTSGTCIAGASGVTPPPGSGPGGGGPIFTGVDINPELRGIAGIAKQLVWRRMWWVNWYKKHATGQVGIRNFPRP